jgi:hypothetical protein
MQLARLPMPRGRERDIRTLSKPWHEEAARRRPHTSLASTMFSCHCPAPHPERPPLYGRAEAFSLDCKRCVSVSKPQHAPLSGLPTEFQ